MAATQAEIDRVLAAYDNAKTAKDYSDSIVIEMQQVSGTDYKLVWTNQYPTN
jgi:hypothetical protein